MAEEKDLMADVREELGWLIGEITEEVQRRGRDRLKASPLLRLYDHDLLTVDYIMEEYQRVNDRTSRQGSNTRRTIKELMESALMRLSVKALRITDAAGSSDETDRQPIEDTTT